MMTRMGTATRMGDLRRAAGSWLLTDFPLARVGILRGKQWMLCLSPPHLSLSPFFLSAY